MPLDIIDPKTLKPPPPVKNESPPKNVCKIWFDSKSFEKSIISFFFMIH